MWATIKITKYGFGFDLSSVLVYTTEACFLFSGITAHVSTHSTWMGSRVTKDITSSWQQITEDWPTSDNFNLIKWLSVTAQQTGTMSQTCHFKLVKPKPYCLFILFLCRQMS